MRPLTASARPAEHPLALLAHHGGSLDVYARYLRQASYQVEETNDGRQALALAFSRRPHVVIADACLRGFDGFQLCEVLKSDRLTQATPIIVVTTDGSTTDIAHAERVGADVVLTTPCVPQELINALEFCRVRSKRVRERAAAAHHRAEEQLAHSTDLIERARAVRRRIPLSHALNRHTTASPPLQPPVLRCPLCDAWLVHRDSHLGGVSASHPEQWDYYDCPSKCGTFQHRQRTRNVRKVSQQPVATVGHSGFQGGLRQRGTRLRERGRRMALLSVGDPLFIQDGLHLRDSHELNVQIHTHLPIASRSSFISITGPSGRLSIARSRHGGQAF